MRNRSIAAFALIAFARLPLTARPQDPPKTAAEIMAAMEADLQGRAADLYGSDYAAKWHELEEGPSASRAFAIRDKLPLPAPPQPVRNPGTISAARLRHTIPKQARNSFQRAQKLSSSGDHSAAAKELEKTVVLDPEFAEAYIDLGVQYYRLGRYSEAEAQLRRAIALDPSSSVAYSNLAAAQLGAGNIAAAEKNARRALDLSGSNARARFVLGVVLVTDMKTRPEGLLNLEYAARSIPSAKEVLKGLQAK